MSLKRLMEETGLIAAEISRISGFSEATISQIKNGKYGANKDQIEQQILEKLAAAGYKLKDSKITVRADMFVMTRNVKSFNALCDELLDPNMDITSSIGLVTGIAGRGKTRAATRYASQHPDVAYILNIEGYSLVNLVSEIAFELGGTRPGTFGTCLSAIDKATAGQRRLIIIDEADLMKKRFVESLRNINERCACPILLVGEEALKNKLQEERRLESRIRQEVNFDGVGVADVAAYYQMAVGLEIEAEVAYALHKRSKSDFRRVVKDAIAAARVMNADGRQALTMNVVNALEKRATDES